MALPVEFATKEADQPLSAAIALDWHAQVNRAILTPPVPSFRNRLGDAVRIAAGKPTSFDLAFKKAIGSSPLVANTPIVTPGSRGGQGPNMPLLTRIGNALDYAMWGDPKAFFPPGYPLPAQAPESAMGRKYDYPFFSNVQIMPRAYESITFDMLRDVSRNSWDVLRLVIETAKSQIASQTWNILPTTKRLTKIPSGTRDRMDELTRFFQKPDMIRSFDKWMRMLLEDLFVIDAPCVYVDRCLDGSPYALRPIDGGTIATKLDYWGDTPQYPETAYQQVIKGLPALDYTVRDMLYVPYNQSTDRAYGFSPVEQILMTINIAARRQQYQLEYYKSGANTPFLLTAPPEFTPTQLETINTWYNSMFVDNPAQRWRTVILPYGSKPIEHSQTSRIELKDDMDDYLCTVASYAFSVDKSQLQKMMNRASAQHSGTQAEKEGFAPFSKHVRDTLTEWIHDLWGYDDVMFGWGGERSMYQLEHAQCCQIYAALGAITINELREDLGKDPLDGGDQCVIPATSQLIQIDEVNPLSKQNNQNDDMQAAQLDAIKNPPMAAGANGNGSGPKGRSSPGPKKPSPREGGSGNAASGKTPGASGSKPSAARSKAKMKAKKAFDVSPASTSGLQDYDLEGDTEKFAFEHQSTVDRLIDASTQINHSGGDYGSLWWNDSTKEAWWVSADSDAEPQYSSEADIRSILSVSGVEEVHVDAEVDPPDSGYIKLGHVLARTHEFEPAEKASHTMAIPRGHLLHHRLKKKRTRSIIAEYHEPNEADVQSLSNVIKEAFKDRLTATIDAFDTSKEAAENSSHTQNARESQARFQVRRPNDHLVFLPAAEITHRLMQHKDIVNPVDGERLAHAKRVLASDQPLYAPEIDVNRDGSAVISDGRHRYRAMRDAGYHKIPIALSEASLVNARNTNLVENYSTNYYKATLPLPDDELKQRIKGILRAGFKSVADEALPVLSQTAQSAAREFNNATSHEAPPIDSDDLNSEIAQLALDRAGELVGMKWDSDAGKWIENPDAQWTITEDVRDELAHIVARAAQEKWSNQQLKDAISSADLFSDERADTIARTELKRIDSMGAALSAKRAGASTKSWQTVDDDHVCSECLENEQQGEISIDDDFPSGDPHPPAHPGTCRCVTIYHFES